MQTMGQGHVTVQLDLKLMGIVLIAMVKPPAEQQASSIKSRAKLKVANAFT